MKVLINLAGSPFIANLDKTAQISPHFKLSELANNKGDTNIPQYEINRYTADFLQMLEQLRTWYNKPIVCNSCYRQKEYNESCGGQQDSLHLIGLAFDWGVKHNSAQQYNVVNEWRSLCKLHNVPGVIGVYSWGYHLSPYLRPSQIAKGITGFYTYYSR